MLIPLNVTLCHFIFYNHHSTRGRIVSKHKFPEDSVNVILEVMGTGVKDTESSRRIHIIRHGEALHNVTRNTADRDPPLTSEGHGTTQRASLPIQPDILLISPMTRTLQTALNMFPSLHEADTCQMPVQIWPELREAHDAECNKGRSRSELSQMFPQFDFSSCSEEWNYPLNTVEAATARAENVRSRLKELSATYSNIGIITHRGFIAYLVKGRRFNTCETRTYRFATEEEIHDPAIRRGINCDTLSDQDFGPTVLILEKNPQQDIIIS